MIPAELARAIEGRHHWTTEGEVAVYSPPGTADTVRVRLLARPARAATPWHAVLIRGDGTAAQSLLGYSAAEVVKWAQRLRPPPRT